MKNGTFQFQLQLHFSTVTLAMVLLQTWRQTAFSVFGYLNFTKAAFLDHSRNFKPEDMEIQMPGKNCIVTGANSGIGYATAEGLAKRGATVYLVCRNKERGEAALSEIQTRTGNQNVHLEICDLSSVNEIKSFTSRFSKRNVPLHVLVNNAGILEQNRVTTPEGFELNFAVNVLGTYTITELMVPILEKASPDARVITVSSGGMYTSPLTKDLQTAILTGLNNMLETSVFSSHFTIGAESRWLRFCRWFIEFVVFSSVDHSFLYILTFAYFKLQDQARKV
ncbi:uncharacterized protein [Phaseolus vulgaris]|uniref:uncharacterized protein isoform X2 n=1 Tax=Phaseolus vulgaris TaxID=3885 RepID=UPI0035CB4A45